MSEFDSDDDFDIRDCDSDSSEDSFLIDNEQDVENEELEAEKSAEIPQVKDPKSKIEWNIIQTFDSVELGVEFVTKQNQWCRKTKNILMDSYKIYFGCKYSHHMLKNVQNCSTVCLINVFTSGENNGKCEIQVGRLPHTCNPTKILTVAHKETMRDAFINGLARAPSRMNAVLKSKGLSELSSVVICNFVQRVKKSFFDPIKTYEEFEEWCQGKQDIPPDVDSVFLIGLDSVKDEGIENYLRAVFTTRRLLQLASLVNHLHADGTYKLNLHGLPVIVVGTTDKNRHFHPFCISVCTHERTADYQFVFQALKVGVERETSMEFSPDVLIADAAESITKGFAAVFGEPRIRVMCWFHLMMNVKKKLKTIKTVEKRQQLRLDICHIHRSPNPAVFQKSCQLFDLKWRSDPEVTGFLLYFTSNWVNVNSGWFFGIAPGLPLTNNALESTNAVIKRNYTLWEKLVFTEFLSKLMEVTCDWSTVRNPTSPNFKPFNNIVTVPDAEMRKALQWKSSVEVKESEKLCTAYAGAYDSKSKSHLSLTNELIKLHESYLKRCSWPDFDTFKFHQSQIWRIKFDLNDWSKSSCSCPVFIKDYFCKHSLGIGMKKKRVDQPDQTEIMANPSRGRPKGSENLSSPQQSQSQAGSSSQRAQHRPSKVGKALEVESGGKRKRGRPRKIPVSQSMETIDDDDEMNTSSALEVESQGKRRRGRPRKLPVPASQAPTTERTPMIKRLRSATQN